MNRIWLSAIAALLFAASCSKKTAVAALSPSAPVTVDVKVNGSDGPLDVDGSPLSITWESEHAKRCEIVSPVRSGLDLNGKIPSIPSGHPFYPKRGQTAKLLVRCSGEGKTAWMKDSVLVRRP